MNISQLIARSCLPIRTTNQSNEIRKSIGKDFEVPFPAAEEPLELQGIVQFLLLLEVLELLVFDLESSRLLISS